MQSNPSRKHFNYIVLGMGLTGASLLNLLSQIDGINILNIGLKDNLPVQSNNSSLKFQGWLISGLTWYEDPYKLLPAKFFKEFLRISRLFNLSNSQLDEFKESEIRGVAILNESQFRKIGKLNKYFPEIVRIKNYQKIRKLIGREPEKDKYYIKLDDIPYNSSRLINALDNYSTENAKADVTQVFCDSSALIDGLIEPGKLVVTANGQQYTADQIFLCTGANNLEVINNIQRVGIKDIYFDENLKSKHYTGEFKFTLPRAPVAIFKDNKDIGADVLVDLSNRYAIVRHNNKLVINSSKHVKNLDNISLIHNQNDDDLNEAQLLRGVYKDYPLLTHLDTWFCIRLERSALSSSHNGSARSYTPTIAPWVGRLEEFPNVIHAVSGKGTLALDTAKQMIAKCGILLEDNIDYKVSYSATSNLFECQFEQYPDKPWKKIEIT